jgi:hypothetical protein
MPESVPPRDDEVISSIRRSVGDEASAGPGAPGRLILTPALRVGTEGGPAETPPAPVRDKAPPTPPMQQPASAEASSLEQRIAELEAAFAGCDDEWEPDGTETLAAATGWSRPAAAPAPHEGRAAETASSRDPVAGGGGASGPLAVQDDEALRKLVATIIRQELEGDLGERMSQNVRKLVRCEINRALTTREMD